MAARKKAKVSTSAKKASTPASMSPAQKTIFNKLKRKGMSDKQASAFSHHAAKRKAASKTSAGPKPPNSKRATARSTPKRKTATGPRRKG